MKLCASAAFVIVVGAALAAAPEAAYMTYAESRSILDELREDLWPRELQGQTPAQIESAWPAWVEARDRAIRARVAEGDEDSLVHLLLFGTSFTKRPRATSQNLVTLASAPDAGLAALKPRLDDFIAAVAAPGADDRLQFARDVIGRHAPDARTAGASAPAVRQYLETRTKQWAATAPSAALLAKPGAAPVNTATLFRDRGLSSDTSLFIDYAIERALEDLEDQGVVASGAIRRVAIIGPGLDFVDKQYGFDFYPQQTIQPFAVIDSLLRFGLTSLDRLEVVAFDLNPRVIAHLEAAQQRAGRGAPYPLVLPQSLERPWAPPVVEYWERLGNWIEEDAGAAGKQKPAAPPPPNAGQVKVRSLLVRPAAVRAIASRDLDIVLQRIAPTAAEQFDLIVATNILLYYDTFEQSLAAANVAAMLKPGGVFLTNNRIVELPGTPLASVGFTDVTYMALPGIGDTGDRIAWYQKP